MSRQGQADTVPFIRPLSAGQMWLALQRLTTENTALIEEVAQLRAAVMIYREVGDRLSLRLRRSQVPSSIGRSSRHIPSRLPPCLPLRRPGLLVSGNQPGVLPQAVTTG